nr:hypothetical protein CFP56_60212 [Quercus suber]
MGRIVCDESTMRMTNRVGQRDVGGGEKGFGQRRAGCRPQAPIYGRQTAWSLTGVDTGRDDGDDDGGHDGDEVDVPEEGELGKARWQSEDEEQDGGDDAPDEGADLGVAHDVDPSDGPGQGVRSDEQDQVQDEHDAGQDVAELAPDQADTLGVIIDVRILDLDLADDVAGGNGGDDEADGQVYPTQLVEALFAGGEGGDGGEIVELISLFRIVLGIFGRRGRGAGVTRACLAGFGDGAWKRDDFLVVGGHGDTGQPGRERRVRDVNRLVTATDE